MRSGLASLPKALQARGYRTAAFVGNWTLRDKLSGLAEHFELYEEVLTRRRWMGLIRSEATADDVTARAIDWATDHIRRRPRQPFLLWVHYVEPHAPYRLQKEFVEPLGLGDRNVIPDADRYDTEIAYVDRSIGELMAGLEDAGLPDTITVFTADHGESLGEHGYWGHGRHLYEPTLRIPMGIHWPGHIEPTTIAEPALLIDLAPTLLGLIDERPPAVFEGYDWTSVLLDGATAPAERVTRYQAHRGAVITRHDSDLRRKNGLLEVGMIADQRKEIYRIGKSKRWVFDLSTDPLELGSLSRPTEEPSEGLVSWADLVVEGLSSPDLEPVEPLDEDAAKMMETLGYVD